MGDVKWAWSADKSLWVGVFDSKEDALGDAFATLGDGFCKGCFVAHAVPSKIGKGFAKALTEALVGALRESLEDAMGDALVDAMETRGRVAGFRHTALEILSDQVAQDVRRWVADASDLRWSFTVKNVQRAIFPGGDR